MASFTHLNESGQPTMVNVADKAATARSATARAVVSLGPAVMDLLEGGDIRTAKGAVFQTAILAGIMAAKRTGELIPLCHPLPLENVSVDIQVDARRQVVILCTARLTGKTGVEMEALTGASLAALTVYDMCKALSHDIVIQEVCLLEKTGGKRDFRRQET